MFFVTILQFFCNVHSILCQLSNFFFLYLHFFSSKYPQVCWIFNFLLYYTQESSPIIFFVFPELYFFQGFLEFYARFFSHFPTILFLNFCVFFSVIFQLFSYQQIFWNFRQLPFNSLFLFSTIHDISEKFTRPFHETRCFDCKHQLLTDQNKNFAPSIYFIIKKRRISIRIMYLQTP